MNENKTKRLLTYEQIFVFNEVDKREKERTRVRKKGEHNNGNLFTDYNHGTVRGSARERDSEIERLTYMNVTFSPRL